MEQGSERSSKIQPEPESNDRMQPEPEDNDRRPALFNNFNFFKRKSENSVSRVPAAKEVETKSNSFWVPPPNKNLKSITSEELKNDDNILAVLSSLSCACALAGNEQTFLKYSEEESYVLYFRCALLIISIASVIWVVRRYQMLLVHQVLIYTVGVKDTLWTSGLWKTMTIEILIHSFFSPPGIDYRFTVNTLGYEIEYSLDDILTILALFRLYTLLRLFGHHSIYTQKTAETVCERNGESADSIFALKSFIQDSPFLGIGIVFISLSLFSAVVMRIFERPEIVSDGKPIPSNLSELSDNLWVIFFTTTTVGYGNIYPITHMGRLTCILACIFGNMYLGMLVVAINQKMDHSDSENLSYAWIYRHYVKNNTKKHALKSIRLAATLYLLSKRWKCNCISPIKPNPPVNIGECFISFDRRFLNEKQFIKKCQIYRDMKGHLMKMKDIIDDARNIGRKEIENIKLIEDTVRVDTSIIFNKIQKMITRDTLLINSQTSHSQTNIEKKLVEVKEMANKMRKTMRTVLRRQNSQDDSPLLRRVSLANSFMLS
jgi:hypothetical protein